ncbi:hypothetical protein F0562_027880 [Nyssa sinensis]|uniref:non-specific serine/threonine protein kinase n=1 Tax=Nyssa sinensis TaxID=561372 RepID=A0A5J5B963_9ASTE|nr:hypothetical protein F0562_027880 [Nyssa sinensis]
MFLSGLSQLLRHPLDSPSLSWTKKVGALDANTDREALLNFKSMVSDPLKALSGWNSNSSHCTWFGVSCTKGDNRVSSLSLAELGLSGATIPPQLSNLSSLEVLNLFNNSFCGQIPKEFSQLTLLQHIILATNKISGTIPVGLSQCYGLKVIRLEHNQLTGHLPPELGNLSRLEFLDVSLNNLTSIIPPTFGNLTSLTYLALARNQLIGNIPNELGFLRNLHDLQLSENQFTGKIPNSISNMSSLVFLSLTDNDLSGELPTDMWTSLQKIFLANNRLEGVIPGSLSNASQIQELDLSSNNFKGTLPLLGKMKNLVKLHLGGNNLFSTTELNLQVMNSLSNCTQLEYLLLNSNRLAGELPSSVANLSTNLKEFCVDDNFLSGRFPQGFERFQNLMALHIHKNSFTSEIPSSIGKLRQLQLFTAQRNRFSGPVPEIFGNLTRLYFLTLGYNQFSGRIPVSIGKCQHLETLGLPGNRLDGSIPKEIFGLPNLRNFYLAQNILSGSLPLEVGTLAQLEALDVSNNMLSGNIPTTIGFCLSLSNLSLAGNKFVGSIPVSMGKLVALNSLDLSSNTLSGQIPIELENLRTLKYLNLSFNDLEGQVPTKGIFANFSWDSFQGNEKLCGSDQEVAGRLRISTCSAEKKSNKNVLLKILIPVAISIILVGAIFLFTWALICRKQRAKGGTFTAPPLKGSTQMISYSEIWHATNGFAAENLIGKGGFGSVYKGTFSSREDGGYTTLAIKVLDLQLSKACKSFNAECEALRNVRHRNLVKVFTSCSSIDHKGAEFKALIMEFMTYGNLHQWLYPEDIESGSTLSLTQRLSIAIDVASAMDYLHHDCDPPIVHCDLKPGNVLLDDDMGGHVGDFGLARFLSETPSQNQSSTIGLKGSIGYIAPEYGLGSNVSMKGDVYSFGVLLLEIFTGKKPTDEMFQEGLNLNKFASAVKEKHILEIIDPRLVNENGYSENSPGNSSFSGTENISSTVSSNTIRNWNGRSEECLADVIRVGLSCAAHLAKDRLTMRETLKKLQDIKASLLDC